MPLTSSAANTLQEIRALMKEDKTLPPALVNRLQFGLLLDIGDDVVTVVKALSELETRYGTQIGAIEKRIEGVEGKSIVIQTEKHPKVAAFFTAIIVLLIMVWNDYGPYIARALGIPAP